MKNTKKVEKLLNSPAVHSWRNIFVTYRALFSHFETRLLELGCTVPRFQILLHIYTDGPLTPVVLSRKMSVSRANMTTFLKRLADDGLIISTEENATVKRPAWNLTAAGVQFFENILPEHISNIQQVVEPLSTKSFKILDKMRENIQNISNND